MIPIDQSLLSNILCETMSKDLEISRYMASVSFLEVTRSLKYISTVAKLICVAENQTDY